MNLQGLLEAAVIAAAAPPKHLRREAALDDHSAGTLPLGRSTSAGTHIQSIGSAPPFNARVLVRDFPSVVVELNSIQALAKAEHRNQGPL